MQQGDLGGALILNVTLESLRCNLRILLSFLVFEMIPAFF